MSSVDLDLFDDSRWPLLHIQFPRTLSAREHETFLVTFGDYLQRGERILFLIDLRQIGLVPLEQRWRQIEWFNEYEGLLRERVIGTALIITSPAVRLSLSAILYFKSLPIPLATFAHPDGAEAWAAERLQEEGRTQAGKRG